MNMHHPDSMWIEYTMRRDDFLGEANLDRLAELAARARRKPGHGPSQGRRRPLGALATGSIAWLPSAIRSVRQFRD
jgi:hypothetical protein